MKYLFFIFLFELTIGGGGRLVTFGDYSLRIYLFAICLVIYFSLTVANKNQPGLKASLILVLLFFLTHLHGILNGLMSGYSLSIIFTQFQQVLFWLIAPFFAYVLSDIKNVKTTASIIKFSSLLMSISFLALMALSISGYINLLQFYSFFAKSGEFFMRSDLTLYYKGFLYLAVGLIFVVALRDKNWQLYSFILILALIITLTRGLWIVTFTSIMLLLFAQKKLFTFSLLFVFSISALMLFFSLSESVINPLGQNHLTSNAVRVNDLIYIKNNITLQIFLFGDGYGSLINQRPQIENSFLYILWLVGFIGLSFWFIPLMLASYYFVNTLKIERNNLACAFYFGLIAVYIQSLFNPYINNPIGLSYLIISIFSLRTIYLTLSKNLNP